jgi:hypothetical protein
MAPEIPAKITGTRRIGIRIKASEINLSIFTHTRTFIVIKLKG